MKPKILCVCSMGENRSKYLASYLKNKGYRTRYGGIGHGRVNRVAHNPFSKEDVEWADIIIVVRKRHKPLLKEKFITKGKKIIALDVTDSRRLILPNHPEFEKLDFVTLQRKRTYPRLRKAIKPHLPLK